MLDIRDDEQANSEGLPICIKCHKPRYIINPDTGKAFRCRCQCQTEQAKQQERQDQLNQQTTKIETLKFNSLLGKRYKNVSFATSEIDENNKNIYEKVQNYAERYAEMIDKGNGFYVHGSPGIGKTHLLACLCNYLTEHLQTCAFTNFLQIAEDIKSAYASNKSEEMIVLKYSNVTFLFIDDFGKESFKKLRNDSGSSWLDEKIFEILNNRYNKMLPTIFSSNYTPQELSKEFGFDDAILDRVLDLSTIIFKMSGTNRRLRNRTNEW